MSWWSIQKEAFLDYFHYFRLCIFWAFIGLYRRYNGTERHLNTFLKRPTNWMFLIISIFVIVSASLLPVLYSVALYEYIFYCWFVLTLYGASVFAVLLLMAFSSPGEIEEELLD